MKKWALVYLLTAYAGVLFAQKDDSIFIKKVSDEILANGKAYTNLRVLTKEIGARLAGSGGMVLSEQWGLQLMKESGADKAWMQECMVPHWVRGGTDLAEAVYTEPAGKTKTCRP